MSKGTLNIDLVIAIILTMIGSLVFSPLAKGQPIDIVPRDLYTERMRQDGNVISFCINPPGVLAEFERDLARAIADTLLTDLEIVEVPEGAYTTRPLELDYRMGLGEEQIYVLMAEECDAFMGFILSSANPTWAMVTRPYVISPVVLVTKIQSDPATVPPGSRVGVRLMSAGDNRLIQYLNSIPEAERWHRINYADNRIILNRLDEGNIDAAMMWEIGVYAAVEHDPADAGYTIFRELPFPVDPVQIGIATRAEDTFLNNLLSDAIASLQLAGVIDDLLIDHGLTPVSGQ